MQRLIFATIVYALLLTAVGSTAYADLKDEGLDVEVARKSWITLGRIEQRYRIPRGLLASMSLVETGQGMQGFVMPWPYSININSPGVQVYGSANQALDGLKHWNNIGFNNFNVIAGEYQRKGIDSVALEQAIMATADANKEVSIKPNHRSMRFPTKAKAESFVENIFKNDYTNVDIGLMQINWKFHGENFTNLSQAFDPLLNANYAVKYLLEHYKTKKDWWKSVGRYHSGTPKHAQNYIRNVWNMYSKIHKLVATAPVKDGA